VKFYELKKGQSFRFADIANRPVGLAISAGVDGAYGRYVPSYSDWRDPEEWLYCKPLDEVVPE
jgi:hypothetical protein